MKKPFCILLLVVIIILNGCSFSEKSTIKTKIKENVPYPKSTNILYTEPYKDGTIVLYQDQTGFRAGFFKKDYFDGSGNAELNPQDGIDYTMINDPNVPITLFAGVITDSQIAKIVVKQKTLHHTAKIIKTIDGKIIWLTTFKTLENSDPDEPDPLKIEAFDKDGNLIWKDGVYENGYFHGKTHES